MGICTLVPHAQAVEAISRSFTVVNHTQAPLVYREAISRPFTVVNHTQTPLIYREAISRAFTVVNTPKLTIAFREAISRPFTVINHTTTPLIYREAISRAFTVRLCTATMCDDDDVCSCDRCLSGECDYFFTRYGDTKCGEIPSTVDLDDILCTLSGFSNFVACPNADIAPACVGNDRINLDDILAVLAAFSGADPCGCTE